MGKIKDRFFDEINSDDDSDMNNRKPLIDYQRCLGSVSRIIGRVHIIILN